MKKRRWADKEVDYLTSKIGIYNLNRIAKD